MSRLDAELFLREARAAAQLRHPNIVAVHEVGLDGEAIYIVADYVPGTTLADWLTTRRPSAKESASVCAVIADALHHAHQAGVIHRDLKPSNIMITFEHGKPVPHILDFGVAKRDRGELTLTSQGQLLGTPMYMSPEQARGEAHQANARTDVYSLGVILYEMLTGRSPFCGEKHSVLYQVLHIEPLPPRALNLDLPRDLDTICVKAMSKDSARRYATAREFADDLRRYLEGVPIRARRVGVVEKAVSWARRNKLMAGLCGLLIVATAALLWSMERLRGDDPRRAVRIVTDPAGARIVAVPLSSNTGEPVAERAIRPSSEARTPCILQLHPGDYFIVVDLPGFGFHEVFRTIPQIGEHSNGMYVHTSWTESANGVVEPSPITIIASENAVDGMAHFDGGSFTMGSAKIPELIPHEMTVAPFLLETTEVSYRDYRRVTGRLPLGSKDHGDSTDAATYVTFDGAVRYAELIGRRLPSEAEYEFAATLGGTREFPWGDGLAPLQSWPLGAAGAVPHDQLPISPPVRGLYSNVLEWTSSWNVPYDPAAAGMTLPAEFRTLQQASRIVRGGPDSLLNGTADVAAIARGPRQRFSIPRLDPRASIGFRCARSVRPRYLD